MRIKPKIIISICITAFTVALIFGFILPSFILIPRIALAGEKAATVEVFSSYKDPGATATIFTKDISQSLQVINNVDTSKVGRYSVEYMIEYEHKSSSTTRYVDVVDKESPVITLDGDKEMTLSSMDFYKEPGYSSNDNYDGLITDSVDVTRSIKDATCTITYRSTDSSGNSSQKERIIHIKDIVPPVITLNGASSITIRQGSQYTDFGAIAVDDLDGDLTNRITPTGTVDTSKEGEYTITYSVYDLSGNLGSATRKVTVKSYVVGNNPSKGTIYLTFDDGPSSSITPQILDTLKANGVKATFFIINFTNEQTELVKRAILEGHTIGIHGYSHDYMKIYSSDSAFLENITLLANKIHDYTGYEPFCIRFPGGSSNTVSKKYCQGIMSRLSKEVASAGYVYYDWNVSSGDAAPNGAAKEAIVTNVTSALRKNRSNIVLMHDSEIKQTTSDALQEIIDYGKINGYTFSPITRDTQPIHHGINN